MINARKKFIIVIVTILVTNLGCQKLSYYDENPNKPTQATPSLLLTNIGQKIFRVDPGNTAFAVRHLTFYERPWEFVNYNWSRGSFVGYDILRQVEDLKKLSPEHKNYQGLAKLFRAILFSQLTDTFGDIPYSEALSLSKNVQVPKYDTQEDIYEGLLKELDEANELLRQENGEINGDIIYNGNILKWRRFVNAFRLRLLIHLSKRVDDTKIAVVKQFNDIVSNPSLYPLMESVEDNAQLVFNTSDPSNYYPTVGQLSFGSLVSIEDSFTEILKSRKDPRLFSFAEPVSGKPYGEFESYVGVDAGLSPTDQQSAGANSSLVARRYIDLTKPVNEPLIFMSYSEQELIIAEGVLRGWTNGNVGVYYTNGIIASMGFYGYSGEIVSNYLQQPLITLSTGNEMYKILLQKYIGFFMNSGWESFYEQRRTGIPEFRVGPGTLNNQQVPKRWLYPLGEFQENKLSVESAINRQFPKGDDVNETIWTVK